MKPDFFSRLIERSVGRADTIQPVLPSRFEPLAAGASWNRTSQQFGSDTMTKSKTETEEETTLGHTDPDPSSTYFSESKDTINPPAYSASKLKKSIVDKDRNENLVESGSDIHLDTRTRKAQRAEFATEVDKKNEIPVLYPIPEFDLRPPISSALEPNQREIAVTAIKKEPESEAKAKSDPEIEHLVPLSKSTLDLLGPISSASEPDHKASAINPPSKSDATQSPDNLRSFKVSQTKHGHKTFPSNFLDVETRIRRPNLAERRSQNKNEGKQYKVSRTNSSEAPSTVKVHIGRIEVRAVMAPTQPGSTVKATRPAANPSLDEYLKKHGGVRR
jgi:hypothetical protein